MNLVRYGDNFGPELLDFAERKFILRHHHFHLDRLLTFYVKQGRVVGILSVERLLPWAFEVDDADRDDFVVQIEQFLNKKSTFCMPIYS